MKKIVMIIGSCLGLAVTSPVWADDTTAEVGKQTSAWLELQRGNSAGSETARPMSDDMARRTYQRHVDTFSQPIPKSFVDEQQEFIKN